jgi:hypothetical protein
MGEGEDILVWNQTEIAASLLTALSHCDPFFNACLAALSPFLRCFSLITETSCVYMRSAVD